MFHRQALIEKLKDVPLWDVIVIGGGATGLGIAVDAAARGYSTLLLEKYDFAKGTSSRSTKLVHGGVRYLAQGKVKLVFAALRERGYLLNNAPHLVKKQAFVIPCYSVWEMAKYLAGLSLYDWMAVKFRFGNSSRLSKKQVKQLLPGVAARGLIGGVIYYDGQFDDARLALNLAQTSVDHGGVTLNYAEVTQLLKNDRNEVNGVIFIDHLSGEILECRSKAVINATGVFVDHVMAMESSSHEPLVSVSQGVHLVFPPLLMPGASALLIPKTPDGRVLFVVPWHGHLLVGTTDTPIKKESEEPVALPEEIDFILETFSRYLESPPQRSQVLSVFAGLRPLVREKKQEGNTKELSRDHKIVVDRSRMITITGGKWTTYRKMAEDAVNVAARIGHLPPRNCKTRHLAIHGSTVENNSGLLGVYGTDAQKMEELIKAEPELSRPLTRSGRFLEAQVVWAARQEMAQTVEDVLARRIRLLFLDAAAAIDAAPRTASLLARELHRDKAWELDQVTSFLALASHYLIPASE